MLHNIGKAQITKDNFGSIYNLYFDSLCKYLNFYTNDITIIEDIVQDIFTRLWENNDILEISQAKAYLFRSARNRILNRLRDEQSRHRLLEKWFEEQLHEKSNEDSFDIDGLIQIAYKAIDTLPPKCKEIFLLSKTENLTYKQIANKKQISEKTVENQIGIALKKVRDYLLSNMKGHPYLLLLLAIFSK